MILDLLQNWPVDQEHSLLIGDQESDCIAARAAGIQPHLFNHSNLCQFMSERLEPMRRSGMVPLNDSGPHDV